MTQVVAALIWQNNKFLIIPISTSYMLIKVYNSLGNFSSHFFVMLICPL